MPHYLALTYTEDVDWTAPEQADTLAEYRQFGEENRDTIRSAAVCCGARNVAPSCWRMLITGTDPIE